LAQASALDRRADALAREASELRREAMELRVEVERMERAPLRVVANNTDTMRAEHDTVIMDRVLATVERAGRVSSAYVAEHLGITPARARAALARLTEVGALERSGATRATRYFVPEPEPDRAGEPVSLRVQTMTIPERELSDREVAWTTAEPASHPGVPL
jgi:hypothetical protein